MDNKDLINMLRTLLLTASDGVQSFQRGADHATSASVKLVFLTRAKDCALAASELQQLLLVCGVGDLSTLTPSSTPSSGHGHNRVGRRPGGHALPSPSPGYPDQNVLEDAQRGEDAAVKHYREIVQDEGLPPAVRSVLEIQFEGVLRNQHQIRELCHQAREMSH